MDSGKKETNLRFWIIGFLAFLWFILRTGTNPKRLSYPCQQAVFPLASSWFISVAALIGGSLLLRKTLKFSPAAIGLLGGFWLLTTIPSDSLSGNKSVRLSLPYWEVPNPISKVFVMDNVPPTAGSLAAGDSTVPNSYLADPAIDSLILMMEKKGTYFYKDAQHPNGIVGANNVVVIKANFQWTSRNTTSTDRIKGVINKIINHPSGFTGEIIVCDNTQDIGTGINQNDNNSEDQNQSIINVVNTFHSKGYTVHAKDWKDFWSVVVNEYSQGNYTDGYTYDTETKINYPKFRSPSGQKYISMRYGIWDSLTSSYDASKLCIINMPVLKAHSMAGATIGVKNWIGLLTTAYSSERYGGSTAMHYTYFWGTNALVARIMAVTMPKLTIVDAAWTTRQGPNNLNYLTNTKILAASTNPVSVSWYTAKFVLTPIAVSPGSTNPDLAGSAYRNALTNWNAYFQSIGLPSTKDSSQISVYGRDILTTVNKGAGDVFNYILKQNYPNPFNPVTRIDYIVPREGRVTIKVYDIKGRVIKILFDAIQTAGEHGVLFNSENLPSGLYIYSMSSGSYKSSHKMVVLK